ncbi:MAG: hypothetical protein C4583_11910 [Anaerolineaceae bacterium]|nr:MAG: hypothetical protein C4583_11910 [Anaerolineaceae bacterium]
MNISKLIMDSLSGLLVAFIGFVIGKSWDFLKLKIHIYAGQWFWYPQKAKPIIQGKIFLFLGERGGLLTAEGEFEPLVHLEDAQSVIKLKGFLENYYKEIIVTTNDSLINWDYPVISIGGPVSNSITRNVEGHGFYPLRFLGTPYKGDAKRAIGSDDGADFFSPRHDENGSLVEDVAYIVRMKSPHNPKNILLIFAGCYGRGTYGAIDYILSTNNINMVKRTCGPDFFQLVVRTSISSSKSIKNVLVYHSEIP